MEQAIDAAEAAGDLTEADEQEEVRRARNPLRARSTLTPLRRPAQVLEDLEEKVIEVAAAEESEAAHEQAAEYAASRGDFDEAEDEEMLAEEAAAMAEEAEEELADAVARAKELAAMSLADRLSPTTFTKAVGDNAAQLGSAAATAVTATRSAIRSRIDLVLGDYPMLATFLEWLSLVLPVLILTGGFALLRRDAQGDFSLRSEVLLFGHMYWAGYYGLLASLTLIMYREPPLVAFSRAQPEQYVAYQVLLLLLFIAYVVLLGVHFVVERTPVAGLQLFGGLLVYLHSYLTVSHPALKAGLPPTSHGFFWFLLYALIFSSMTGLIKRERKGKVRPCSLSPRVGLPLLRLLTHPPSCLLAGRLGTCLLVPRFTK